MHVLPLEGVWVGNLLIFIANNTMEMLFVKEIMSLFEGKMACQTLVKLQ